jgi:hypothetical protein
VPPNQYPPLGANGAPAQPQFAGAPFAAPPAPQFGPPPGYPSPQPQYGPPPQSQYGPTPGPPPQRRGAPVSLVVDQTNQRFELRVGSNIIGRGTDADLQLLDHGVSRRHLDVQYDGNFATAYDLGSTNGSAVNGHDISSQLLRHGDVIRVGHTRIVFHQERV